MLYVIDAHLALTGKPMGFLNPLLYQMAQDDPSTFNDITSGNNFYLRHGMGDVTWVGSSDGTGFAQHR